MGDLATPVEAFLTISDMYIPNNLGLILASYFTQYWTFALTFY